MPLFLVADVGGTNTRVAMTRGREVLTDTIRRYRNRDFADLAPVLRRFRSDQGGPAPRGACVAVAGPVTGESARLTNVDWSIDLPRLLEATDAQGGAILNDLQAQGHALGHLAEGSCRPVIDTPASPDGARLVIGVGTGFNAAPVHVTPTGRLVPASESGHAGLPVATEADLRLSNFVSGAHGFAAVEDVLSGRGLERVYHWLATEAGSDDAPLAAEIMARVDSDPRAEAAVRIFVRMMGTVAGDLALVHLPLGGVFLVGGVARAMGPWLGSMGFADAFCDKGRFGDLLRVVPVSLVTDDFAALTGCAAHLSERAGLAH